MLVSSSSRCRLRARLTRVGPFALRAYVISTLLAHWGETPAGPGGRRLSLRGERPRHRDEGTTQFGRIGIAQYQALFGEIDIRLGICGKRRPDAGLEGIAEL